MSSIFSWIRVNQGSVLAILVSPGKIDPAGPDTPANTTVTSSVARVRHSGDTGFKEVPLTAESTTIAVDPPGVYTVNVEVSFPTGKGNATIQAELRNPGGTPRARKFSLDVVPTPTSRNAFADLIVFT